jgi:hypothetical protein
VQDATFTARRETAGLEVRLQEAAAAAGFAVVSASLAASADGVWAMVYTPAGRRLAVAPAPGREALLGAFNGSRSEAGGGALLVAPLTAANAAALRRHLPWLAPAPLPMGTSAGFGDRLGLATPGHVRALRAVGGSISPVFAQQSIREMTRTGRSPQAIIDDATWGSFEAGWTAGQGADADHLKTAADITACAAAGFTMFTIDPGEHVDPQAGSRTPNEIRAAWDALPWDRLETSATSMRDRYVGRAIDVEEQAVRFDDGALMTAAVKYGAAIAHVKAMYRHLVSVKNGAAFDLEVSVDETDTPTSPAEHVFVASELQRLGVRWASLAPRFVGRFEKGVDYIGDLAAFEADVCVHAAVARAFGGYKISLHSGSDKFAIYAVAAAATRGLLHLKTAGTSYLEALRAAAAIAPGFFRAIYVFARERYERDRASYHVSATVAAAPDPAALADTDLPALLEDFHARQILHVTFGSVLTASHADGSRVFADDLRALLQANPEAYAGCLERHFVRHLRPFSGR